ncbi:hypothetical protein DB32_006041 [Sandaracinus amylolyticus]|uniref:Uncharacterized protein n=2 Tax=Sandaracinus amylolyticus TaxID=927083 RepID=A0A0F6W6T4_9BACT|nr:hypothetical protein DB32_006041 [Sandaracinus amylolyticus]
MSVVVGGFVSGTVTLSEGPMSHAPAGTSGWEGDGAMRLAEELQAQLQAELDASFTVGFDATLKQYEVSASSAFSLTFTGEAGLALRRALGFSGDLGAADEHVSDVLPYYLIESNLDGWSKVSEPYEPDEDVVQEAVSDGGIPYAVARDTTELWSDWTQPMEPYALTFESAASSSAPWTWHHFFRHVRGTHRFKVYEDLAAGDSLGVYMLRAEGATFSLRTRAPVVADWRDRWDITFLTRFIQAA